MIPTDAEAIFVLSDNGNSASLDTDATSLDTIKSIVATYNTIIKQEFIHTDADIEITLEQTARPSLAMDLTSTYSVILVLTAYPNGVQKMSQDLKGLVQTSLNLGILSTILPKNETGAGAVSFKSSVRSSVGAEKKMHC